jgi:nitroimidazol reductase NimA-like FMN-containing flavoprotein (pyridoxamine 5'-phosphate oxidase superfamily)
LAQAQVLIHEPVLRGDSAVVTQQPDDGRRQPVISEPIVEVLDKTESLSLIAAGGVGRIGYTSRFGPAVLPVNYDLYEQTIVFRTGLHSSMVEDLRTGIADAEYNVAFEIDHIQPVTQEGWSVLIQGAAHFVDSDEELAPIAELGVQAWTGGPKEQFIRIFPQHITGRRIRRSLETDAG